MVARSDNGRGEEWNLKSGCIKWARIDSLQVHSSLNSDTMPIAVRNVAGESCAAKFFARIGTRFDARGADGRNFFGNISRSLFGRRGGTNETTASVAAYRPEPGTYAHDVLQRRFKELDQDGVGYITEADLKMALKKLNLPASEQDVQDFISVVVDKARTHKITFEQFAEYSVNRENQLLETFKELDKRKIGYITVEELKAGLRKYKFRISDEDVSKMVRKRHVRGEMLEPTNFNRHREAFDFAEYRDLLMLSTAKDLRDTFEIWGRAVIDLGDIDTSFPMSSGKYDKIGRHGQQRPKTQVLKHLLAGSVAAIVSRTVVAPLERLKVLCMVYPDIASQGSLAAFKKIWREERLRGLFKGNLLNVLRIVPTKAVEFFVYDKIKGLALHYSKRDEISGIERMILGSIASMAGTFVTYPMDTVRSVITAEVVGPGNSVAVLQSIFEKVGLSGLYKGIGPNMARVASYGAINFLVYDQLNQWYRKRVGPGGELGTLPTITFGALAGASAQTVVYSLEMVQRRMQVQATQSGKYMYKNMIDAFQVIIQEEGFHTLYAGLLPNYIKLVPAAAISFLVYEALKKQLKFS